MDGSELKELLAKYRAGDSTAEEKALLENWVAAVTYPEYEISEKELLEDLSAIRNSLPLIKQQITVRLWPRIAVAAAAVAAIVVGAWLFSANHHLDRNAATRNLFVNDIAPGRNGATITLANGKVIQLSDAKSGVMIEKAGLKYSDGVAVQGGGTDLRRDDVKLVAATGRGQTYQFTLPDGTKVWLNADSKLEFPSNFVNSKTRFVRLSGEGYFEVSKDKTHPFIVGADKQKIEVLGTHFNVNSYEDRGTITSLLEGSVKLTNDIEGRVLKPGEIGASTIKGIMLLPGDVNDAVAWKNGYFRFRGEQIQPIMEQLARWYDIEVSYQGKMPMDGFNGKVSRNKNISQVLKALEAMKIVHFKVEGRRVTVIN